jgi:hypothetical protein
MVNLNFENVNKGNVSIATINFLKMGVDETYDRL